jgi:hypothetical protein
VFYKLHGVRTIDVHIATCGKRNKVQTWKELESSLLDTFRTKYLELPHYNKVRPRAKDGLFSDKRARGPIVSGFVDVRFRGGTSKTLMLPRC